MNFKSFAASVIATAILAMGSVAAHAAPLIVTDAKVGPDGVEYYQNLIKGETVTLNGSHPLGESNVAGFQILASSVGKFYTFCTDIAQPMFPLPNSYTVEANGSANGFSLADADLIAKLFTTAGFNSTSGFGAGNNTIVNFVAMQMAVWNVLYDSDLSVNAGSFQMFTNANGAQAQANAWLASASTLTSANLQVNNLYSGQDQDILITSVPEPSAYAMALVAALGLGAAARRRAKA